MKTNASFKILLALLVVTNGAIAQVAKQKTVSTNHPSISKVWVADNGDGTYKNPIIHADYSDPDAIRVGNDYYMVASSFNQVPGLPILHSKDLVNWKLITHVFKQQPPYERFKTVQHGGGVWAPAIRYHKGEFYIYYPDPDEGIYVVKAKQIQGPWTLPLLVKKAKGWIDPCPFWDEDGNAYLANGMAASRSGIKSVLIINKMSADGTKLLDDGVMVFDGHDKHPTIEGPKVYKRNGYYYILAPAGGVGKGWQLALRSKNIYGPYEEKIVLEQGSTITNGPHQGALVETQTGESWFLHFQDKDAYGRIVHLQPVTWKNDWPFMGKYNASNGLYEPVLTYKKPNVGNTFAIQTPQESDEFNSNEIGLQWQWAANPQPGFCFPAGGNYGFIRLFNLPIPENENNWWNVGNLLTQKFPAPDFTATTKIHFTPRTNDEETGLIISGIDYAYISLKKTEQGLVVTQTACINAEKGKPETKTTPIDVKSNTIYFKVKVSNFLTTPTTPAYLQTAENSVYGNATCQFSYSVDGVQFIEIGKPFAAKKGKWIGAKVGLFAVRKGTTYENGYADVDWFRIAKE